MLASKSRKAPRQRLGSSAARKVAVAAVTTYAGGAGATATTQAMPRALPNLRDVAKRYQRSLPWSRSRCVHFDGFEANSAKPFHQPLTSHSAEVLSRTVLEKARLSRADLLAIFDLLPTEAPPSAGRSNGRAASFGTGLWVHGGLVGLRANTFNFPNSTKVLNKFLKQECPRLSHTTVLNFQQAQTAPHKDSHSAPGSLNAVFGLSTFSGVKYGQKRKEDKFLFNTMAAHTLARPFRCALALHCSLPVRHCMLLYLGQVADGSS